MMPYACFMYTHSLNSNFTKIGKACYTLGKPKKGGEFVLPMMGRKERKIIMKTIVYQLGTRNEYIYTVSPEQAVVDAYYQYGLNNYNTWEYDYSLVRYSVSTKTVYCGDFVAKAE